MEILVMLLTFCVCLNFIIKISCWEKVWSVLIISALCSLFLLLAMPYCIKQSKTQIAVFLANPKYMLDVSAYITLESTLAISYCFMALYKYEQYWKRLVKQVLLYFTGISIFIVLFFAQTKLVFAMPGVSFPHLSLIAAIFTGLCIPLLWWIVRKVLPEKDIRLELYFLGNLLLIALTIICTVNRNTAVEGTNEISWPSLLTNMVTGIIGIGLGYLMFLYRRKRIQKKIFG